MTLTAPKGGSEILLEGLSARVDLSQVNIILSRCDPRLLHPSKPNILWQHLNTNEAAVQGLRDVSFVNKLYKIVFVSNWQREKFIREFGLPPQKCITIHNAIEPIAVHTKPSKIRLIYTSTPWRGLDKLIEAYKVLDRDVELVVYSGTSIYGKAFADQTEGQFDHLYAELKALDVTHIEYAPNDEVRKVLTQAHILAYPNTWEETSCLSAIEALAAGCKVVTTRNGALPETCGAWADYADLDKFVDALRYAIDHYQDNPEQVNFYNTRYSWDTRIHAWRSLLDEIKTRKVLIATPSLDGRLDVWYTTSLVNSIRIAQANNIFLHPVFLSYDALIQRARNDLFGLAVEGGYDDIIWIDSDLEWNPMWLMELLSRPEDVIGGTYRKKTDEAEMYVVKTKTIEMNTDGLIKVEGLGMGFVKMSRKAFMALWDNSDEYENEGKVRRMICNIAIVDGKLHSEDTVVFSKLKDLGYDVWLDPKMTCVHIGTKKFYGNFEHFADRLQQKAA